MTKQQRPLPEHVETCLFDLDDCLYRNPEFPRDMAINIQNYMTERLGFPSEGIAAACAELYSRFGTTLSGLVAKGYQIDYDDWHANVHGVLPYDRCLAQDERLWAIIKAMPGRKFVFTNGDRTHAQRCLRLMGLEDCFEGLICFESIMQDAAARGISSGGAPVICKPSRKAFELAMVAAGDARPESTLYFDDSTRNVAAGAEMGLYSVLVGRRDANVGADLEVLSLHELPEVMPQLGWLADPQKALQPLPEDSEPVPTVDEGYQGVPGHVYAHVLAQRIRSGRVSVDLSDGHLEPVKTADAAIDGRAS